MARISRAGVRSGATIELLPYDHEPHQITLIGGAGQSQMRIGHIELYLYTMIPVDDRLDELDTEISLMLCIFV